MKFTPLNNRLVVQLDKPDTVATGGIHIPDSAQTKSSTGIIVSPDSTHISNRRTIYSGTRVAFGKYAGIEITVGCEKYTVLKWEDVIGVFE